LAFPLEPAPEDHRRRRTVDVGRADASPPLAAGAPLLERLVGLQRGEALIDELHG